MTKVSQRRQSERLLASLIVISGLVACNEESDKRFVNPPTNVCGVPFGPKVVSPRPLTDVLDQDGNVQLPTVPPNGNVVIQLAACGKGGRTWPG